MQTPTSWLTKLKAAELHKLAVRIGTPCSGTKAVQVEGIQNALALLANQRRRENSPEETSNGRVSLVSIDMGIRNLAYSHWTTQLISSTAKVPAHHARPTLQAWAKIDISSKRPTSSTASIEDDRVDIEATERRLLKESFEPNDYAQRAHDFVKTVLDQHEPTHVLIEKQRFRSGGNSAVLEWTIRVGVFEGMLYAVLKTLSEQGGNYRDLSVEPMLPARVNKYWLEGRIANSNIFDLGAVQPALRKTAREVKQTKIELVRELLQATQGQSPDQEPFTVSDNLSDTVSAFMDKKPAKSNISKLDDLADCLLQGLAWIHWQNNRLRLAASGQEAMILMT